MARRDLATVTLDQVFDDPAVAAIVEGPGIPKDPIVAAMRSMPPSRCSPPRPA